MIITKLDTTFPLIPPVQRHSGIHVSDIINVIMKSLHGESELSAASKWKMEMGFVWERMAEIAYKDLLGWRPEEILKDGMWLSPDYIRIDKHIVVKELKCTWGSTKRLPQDNFRWITQIKAYCYGVGTNHAQLLRMCINGDYTHPYKPTPETFSLEFTDSELEENWQMLLNHKDQVEVKKK